MASVAKRSKNNQSATSMAGGPDRRDLPVDDGGDGVVVTEDHVADPGVAPDEHRVAGIDRVTVADQVLERGIGDGVLAAVGGPPVPLGDPVDVGGEGRGRGVAVEQEGVGGGPIDVVDRDQRVERRIPQPGALGGRERREPARPCGSTASPRGTRPATASMTKNARAEHGGVRLRPTHAWHRDARRPERLQHRNSRNTSGARKMWFVVCSAAQDERGRARRVADGPAGVEQHGVVRLPAGRARQPGDLHPRHAEVTGDPTGQRRAEVVDRVHGRHRCDPANAAARSPRCSAVLPCSTSSSAPASRYSCNRAAQEAASPTADADGSQSAGMVRLSSISSSRVNDLSAERSPSAASAGWAR